MLILRRGISRMIKGYVIISSAGTLIYQKFFEDVSISIEKASAFAGGIFALDMFMKNIFGKNIDEVIAGDWKLNFDIRENAVIVGVLASKHDNLARAYAHKIADIIEKSFSNEDLITDFKIGEKIGKVLEDKLIDEEIKASNEAENKIKYA